MTTARHEKKQRIEALRRIPLLAGCTAQELAIIDGLGAQIVVAPGRVLTREGTAGQECFVVLEGLAIAQCGARLLGTIGAGSVAGEMALLDDVARNATVVAASAMRLLVLDAREFAQLRARVPAVAAALEDLACARRMSTAREMDTVAEPVA
jgi:CRP-like cAMP-binding protein